MKIKGQLTLGMIIFCVIFLLIGTSVIYTSWHIQKLGKQQEIANNVVRGAYELSYLSNDYLFHLEKRQNIQWDSRFISLGNEIARLDVDKPEQQVLVNRIITNKERLREIYAESVASIESAKSAPGGSVDPEMIQVAWSRFIVQNQGIIFDASQLSLMLNEEEDQLQFTNTLMIFALLGMFFVILLVNYLFISRRILRSLSTLQEGTEIIGSGNLDFTIEENGKDEIGTLSHAFNRMTANLKQVTASKEDLEKEISERKLAEEALRETNAYLNNLFDYANAPIITWDSGFHITRFNHAFEHLTGRSQEEVLGKTLDFLFPDKTRNASMALIQTAFRGERWEAVEIPILTKDGSIRTVIWNSANVLDLDGRTVSTIAQGVDITERKQAEETLRETNEYLRNLIEYANAPIIVWDKAFRITRFNHAFENLTGRTEQETLGQHLEVLFPEKSRDMSLQKIRETLDGRRWEVVEIPILHVSGGTRTVLWNSANIVDPNGSIISTIAQGQDITERKQAEEALRQVNKKLNLLSSITRHDIKNQLMALNGYIGLSEEAIGNPVELKGFIAKEQKIADSIALQIAFTKDYESLGVKSPVWQNFGVLLRDAGTALPMRNIILENQCPGLEVFADPLLEKVFYNLIDNSLRYGGEKMTTIRILSTESEAGLIIAVEDDGGGISPDDKKRLFERGFGKHTGLGLFISREILSLTGISITENGEPGKGARFEIMVPKGAYRFTKATSPE